MSGSNVIRIDTYKLPGEAEGHLNGRPVRLAPERCPCGCGQVHVVFSDTSESCDVLTHACRIRETTPLEEVEAAMSLLGPEEHEIAAKMGIDLRDAYYVESAVQVLNFMSDFLS